MTPSVGGRGYGFLAWTCVSVSV